MHSAICWVVFPCKINVIPVNPGKSSGLRSPAEGRLETFANKLHQRGYRQPLEKAEERTYMVHVVSFPQRIMRQAGLTLHQFFQMPVNSNSRISQPTQSSIFCMVKSVSREVEQFLKLLWGHFSVL